MTIEANAILGLVFWLYSHERQHAYEEKKRSHVLGLWIAASLVSAYFLCLAGLRAFGAVR